MNYKHNKDMVPLAKSLRKNMTPWERKLWYEFLRTYPVKFLRQKPIGNAILDFYCAKIKLAIELDGSQHYQNKEISKDQKRTEFLEEYGITVLRIPNTQIDTHFYEVCQYIDNTVQQSLPSKNWVD